MLPVFYPHRSADQDTHLAQMQVERWVAELKRLVPILDGRLVDYAITGGTDLLLEHGLGRASRGYIVTDRDDERSTPATSASTNPDPTKYLYLTCNITINGQIWVF